MKKLLKDDIIVLQQKEVDAMTIGNNIKQLRQQKNLTQDQVAEKLGVSYQAVSKWENNANTPDIALLPRIADLFGVTIDALFSDSIADHSALHPFMKDDDVIRVVQMRGAKIIKVPPFFHPTNHPLKSLFLTIATTEHSISR